MVRDYGYKIPQIRKFYKKCLWDLASRLRAGGTLAEGVQKVITSPEKHEALSKCVPPDTLKGKGKFAKRGEKGPAVRVPGGPNRATPVFASGQEGSLSPMLVNPKTPSPVSQAPKAPLPPMSPDPDNPKPLPPKFGKAKCPVLSFPFSTAWRPPIKPSST